MTSFPERNVELLEKTMQYIMDHPENHHQEIYLSSRGTSPGECGSGACFAGWAWVLAGNDWLRGLSLVREFPGNLFHDAARDLLGLENSESCVLFDTDNTRAMLQRMVKDLVNGEEMRDWDDYELEAKNDIVS